MKRLCIVEDEPTLLEIYTLIFKEAGFAVSTATNGKTGFEVIDNAKPDLALIDLMMPYVNGAQLIEKIRGKDWGKNLKIIVLTNVGKTESTIDLEKLKVIDVVTKVDIAPADLVNLVQSHL